MVSCTRYPIFCDVTFLPLRSGH
uniref:Uncharacterized protein n=1 Tax=Arundo donax TaxID=35708 RepID=A0A0A9B106_ARUDO